MATGMADSQHDFDVLVIGAGISGINIAYRLQTQCPHKTFAILENRFSVGGTWDLFRYPGIRSDSDVYTFGFTWRPFTGKESIVKGELMREYIKESAAAVGIDRKIRFGHKMVSAHWSSDLQKWRLEVEIRDLAGHTTETANFYANFLMLGTGYYDYESPLQTVIPGLDNFKGTKVHPQWWPEELDYSGKKIVVIGSGATAVTLLPNLAKTASKVTMLQRSPGYIVSLPEVDPFAAWARRSLPSWLAHPIIWWKFVLTNFFFFNFCRAFPKVARNMLRKGTTAALAGSIPFEPHFNPRYNPWEQRMCVVPGGDFFKSLREGKADIATGYIETVTEDGILLKSGQKIDADIIVTATGLRLQVGGGAQWFVDNKPFNWGENYSWRGMMSETLPNASLIIGYTNASWTLGADATAQHLCKLLNWMDKQGYTSVVPTLEGQTLSESSILNLDSTYVQVAKARLPKAGDKAPWKSRTNYLKDLWQSKYPDLQTGLKYYRVAN